VIAVKQIFQTLKQLIDPVTVIIMDQMNCQSTKEWAVAAKQLCRINAFCRESAAASSLKGRALVEELLPEAQLNVQNLMSFMQPLLQQFKQSGMASFTFEDKYCYGLGSSEPDYGVTAQRNKLWDLEQHQPARFAFMMNLIVLNMARQDLAGEEPYHFESAFMGEELDPYTGSSYEEMVFEYVYSKFGAGRHALPDPRYNGIAVGSDEHLALLLGKPPVSIQLFSEDVANSVDCLGWAREHFSELKAAMYARRVPQE
jgi:hypothetical protein